MPRALIPTPPPPGEGKGRGVNANPLLNFFATTAKGCEALLADELRALGASEVKETRAGAAFSGDLSTAYRVCLWSRVASRVLLRLARFSADSPDALYEGVEHLAWHEHIAPDGTLAVDANIVDAPVAHPHYAALRVKDAVVDRLRARFGTRPSVDTERPQVRLNLFWRRDEATLSIDLSGDSLHRRGYRDDTVQAPLKENLAAALLLRAQWPAIARAGGGFVDLMCGSGTVCIEAAMIAADIAPGALRDYFGFIGWRGHDAAAWDALRAEAVARREQGLARLPPISGYDADAAAIRAARRNAACVQLGDHIVFTRRALVDAQSEPQSEMGVPGLVFANPPYGERLGRHDDLAATYRELGAAVRDNFHGWQCAVFTGNREMGRELGLHARQRHRFHNGAMECELLRFDGTEPARRSEPRAAPAPRARSDGAQMFANRLEKNLHTLGRWAAKQGIACYRLYDADMPEYAFAIDLYGGETLHAHVQEYAPPASVTAAAAARRRSEAFDVIPEVLGIPRAQIAFKTRERQRGHAQYERQAARGEFIEVAEQGARLLVNLHDYLDTGLFLDHRPTRLWLREMARGRRFLNLFGYTGAATVHAALGGATATTTVDLSNTYLDWAERNLILNEFGATAHQLVRADVREWLVAVHDEYDVIFLDPPTFSTSKRMQGTLDIQRDHVALIQAAADRLAHGGEMIFSTNARRFRLETDALAGLRVEDVTGRTIARDFARNPRIHQCFRVTRP